MFFSFVIFFYNALWGWRLRFRKRKLPQSFLNNWNAFGNECRFLAKLKKVWDCRWYENSFLFRMLNRNGTVTSEISTFCPKTYCLLELYQKILRSLVFKYLTYYIFFNFIQDTWKHRKHIENTSPIHSQNIYLNSWDLKTNEDGRVVMFLSVFIMWLHYSGWIYCVIVIKNPSVTIYEKKSCSLHHWECMWKKWESLKRNHQQVWNA